MNDSPKLQETRERIDALDDHIQQLINERAALAREIAHLKQDAGEEASFYRPER